jgi:hypothetical protein
MILLLYFIPNTRSPHHTFSPPGEPTTCLPYFQLLLLLRPEASDQGPSIQLHSLLHSSLRSDVTAPRFQRQCTGTLLPTLLPPVNTTCLSFMQSPALSQALTEGPQHSSVRSFIPTHDPMRWPHFSAAAHRCSAHYTSPSGEHHLPPLRAESCSFADSDRRPST